MMDRRRQILDAALAAFLEKGYSATTIADIRQRSGASTGSIYHFFSGKGAIAEALLREAVSGWSLLSAAALDPDTPDEEAVKASVRGLVLWALTNPSQFRFMDELRRLSTADADFAAVRSLLDRGQEDGAAHYARMTARGSVRNLPFAIAHALMLGPAYAYLRAAPNSSAEQARRIADLFADSAWQSVKA